MTQARFARRMVCRALTVLGGVAAGTALAWWLSSTSASAETQVPVDAPPVVQQVAAPVDHTVDVVAQRLQDPPPPPKDALGDLGQQVTDAAKHFQAPTDLPKLPSCDGNLCLHNERHMYPVDGFGRSDLPGTPALAPAPAMDAPGAVTGSVAEARTPHTAKDRASAHGMSRRGSPAPADPGLPNWPAPLPFAPAGVPITANLGSAGNAGDAHLLTALPSQDRAADELVAGGIAAAADAATLGRPNAQPGVLPD